MEEVTLDPGQEVVPHHQAGPVFGYVLEGDYEHALDDDPVKTYKAGDAFYEPSGCVHRVTKNPSKMGKTRLLAVIVHPPRCQGGDHPGESEEAVTSTTSTTGGSQ